MRQLVLKKGISILLTLIMVLGLVPITVWAEGTSCDSFDEFKAAMENPSVETVILNSCFEEITFSQGVDNAITVASSSGRKNLIISGSVNLGQSAIGYENLIAVNSGITLNVSGSGYLSWNPVCVNGTNGLFYLNGGTVHLTDEFSGSIVVDAKTEGLFGTVFYVKSGNLLVENGLFAAYDSNVSVSRGLIHTVSAENTYVTLLGGHYQYSGSGSGESYVILDQCDNLFVDKISYSTGSGFGSNMDSEISVYDQNNYVAWNPFNTGGEPEFPMVGVNESAYLSFRYQYNQFLKNRNLYNHLQAVELQEKSGDSWNTVSVWDGNLREVQKYNLGVCDVAAVKTYRLVFRYEYEFGGDTIAFQCEREIRSEWKNPSYQGIGTEQNPVLVSTFPELRRALADVQVEYVKVVSDINTTLNYNSYTFDKSYGPKARIDSYRQGQLSAEELYQALSATDVTDGFFGLQKYLGDRQLNCGALNVTGKKHLILANDVTLKVNSFPGNSSDSGFKYGIIADGDLTISGGGRFEVSLTAPNFGSDAAAIVSNLGGKLVIEDADVVAKTQQGAGYAHAIYVFGGSSLVIQDGEFRGMHSCTEQGYHQKNLMGAVYLGSDIAEAEINGGTFTEVELGQSGTNSIAGLMVDEGALSKVTLNGGTYVTGIMKRKSGGTSLLTLDEMRNVLKIGATYTTKNNTINGVDYTTCQVTPSPVDFEDGAGSSANNPAYCTTYAELKYALEHPAIRHIVVPSFTNSVGLSYYSMDYKTDYKENDCAINIPSGTTKYLTLLTDVNIRNPHLNRLMYSFIGNYGTLIVDGTGSLNVSFNATGYPSAVIFNMGDLEIAGEVTLDGTNYSFDNQFGYAISQNGGNVVIRDGRFIGYKTSAVLYNRGSMKIYGGSFEVKEPKEQSFGLNTNCYERLGEGFDVSLYGGTYQGIQADQSVGPDTATLSSLLGYGSWYQDDEGNKFNPSGLSKTQETLTVVMPEIIEEVSLTVTAPKENETISYSVGSGSSAYQAQGRLGVDRTDFTRWYESDTGEEDSWTLLSEGAKFEAGKYYKVYIDIKAVNGYMFRVDESYDPDISATVNGYAAWVYEIYDQDPGKELNICINFGMVNDNVIEKIVVTDLVTPVAGELPSYTCSLQGTGYHLDTFDDKYEDFYWLNPPEKRYYIKNGIGWWDVTAGDWINEKEPFIFGHEYKACIYLRADDGYEFYTTGNNYQALVTASINGKTATLKEEIMAQYDQRVDAVFVCEPKIVKKIEISDITPPKAGEKPDVTATVALPDYYQLNPEYGIGGIEWYDGDMEPMSLDDTFDERDDYRLTIQVIPVAVGGENACKFADNITATINGKAVQKDEELWDEVSGGPKKITIFYTFTNKTGSATREPEITFFWTDNSCSVTTNMAPSGMDIFAVGYQKGVLTGIVELTAVNPTTTLQGDTVKVFFWDGKLCPIYKPQSSVKP